MQNVSAVRLTINHALTRPYSVTVVTAWGTTFTRRYVRRATAERRVAELEERGCVRRPDRLRTW